MKYERIRTETVVEGFILGLAFYAASLRALVVISAFQVEAGWIEIGIDMVLILLAFWALQRLSLLGVYAAKWMKNWPLILFMGVAAASMAWSIDFVATLSRVLVLILSSMLATYLSTRYTVHGLLRVIAAFFATLVVACFIIVMIWPDAGRMNFFPYAGSWRGVFWHRNYLGSTMALGVLIFLLCFILSGFGKRIQVVVYAVCYLLSFALVVLSQSATGLILLIVLHLVLAGVALWLKWYPQMRPPHYWAIGALALIALVIGYFKLDFVLGLFNRNSTFTGRASLWAYLFTHIISRRPLLGYGFGALWVQQSFRVQVRDAIGWPYQVMIGDNGYLDMILHVGYVGFLAFMLVLVLACWRMASFAFQKRTLLAFVPLSLMIYVLLTNLTLSYFLETESLVWIIMIALFFAVTPGRAEDKNLTALPDRA